MSDSSTIIVLLTITVILLALVIVVLLVTVTTLLLRLNRIAKNIESVTNQVVNVTEWFSPVKIISAVVELFQR